jgi:hypothetical protein
VPVEHDVVVLGRLDKLERERGLPLLVGLL